MLTPAQQRREQDKKDKATLYWKRIVESGELECRVCHKILPLKDNFTPCLKKFEQAGYLSFNKECQGCRSKRHFNDRHFVKTSLRDVLADRLYVSTIRASNKNLSLDIDLQFLLQLWEQQNGLCYYTKKPLSLEINNTNKVSIDRLDSSRGYTRDNVVLCRNSINYLKGELPINDFKSIIEEIYDNFINVNYESI